MFQSILHLLSDARGQYIPRDFVTDAHGELNTQHCDKWHISADDMECLRDPESAHYWETWDSVLHSAHYEDADGNVWTLWQDGNLWAICDAKMSIRERLDLFADADEPSIDVRVCRVTLDADGEPTGPAEIEELTLDYSELVRVLESDEFHPSESPCASPRFVTARTESDFRSGESQETSIHPDDSCDSVWIEALRESRVTR